MTEELKLHLGCGSHRIDGYCNVDMVETAVTDVVDNIVTLEKFFPNSIQHIITEHVLEHLSFEDAETALGRWFELLVPQASLTLETPDMVETCAEVALIGGSLEHMSDELFARYPRLAELKRNGNWGIYKNWGRMRNIFGSQTDSGQFHKSGWWKERLQEVCHSIGYVDISIQKSVELTFLEIADYSFSYHVLEEPCIRMTAVKP
jgi:predicted SAM-dependent methyltransferase